MAKCTFWYRVNITKISMFLASCTKNFSDSVTQVENMWRRSVQIHHQTLSIVLCFLTLHTTRHRFSSEWSCFINVILVSLYRRQTCALCTKLKTRRACHEETRNLAIANRSHSASSFRLTTTLQITKGQSNLTKSASRGANSPVRGHPRGSKVVQLNSWGRVSY